MINLIFILTILSIVAVWIDAIRAAINSISGGYTRSLENEQRRARAEKWLEHKRQYGFTLRALSFIVTVTFTSYTYYHIIIEPIVQLQGKWLGLKRGLILVLILFSFLIIKEAIGTIWLSKHRYPLLRYSLPLINLMRIPLKPYEAVLILFYRMAKAREEERPKSKEVSPEDEILSLVENDDKGTLEEDERRMIQGVFDLNDKVVREVMTPRVKVDAINSDNSIDDARKKFLESNNSRLPVYKQHIDSIIGILYAKDFLNEEVLKTATIESIMHPPQFTTETKPLDQLLEDFKASQCHFAIVNDEYGGTSGIITIEDVLEEIVGDIRDEYDEKEDALIKVEPDGSLLVDAKAAIDDINKLKPEHQIPDHDDYETIGGCIYSEISRIPVIGEVIELNKYTAEITDADERSITKLILTPKAKAEFEETKS